MKCGQESAGAGSGPVAGSFDHDEPMGSIKGKQFFTSRMTMLLGVRCILLLLHIQWTVLKKPL
jgi:hypothetical protein